MIMRVILANSIWSRILGLMFKGDFNDALVLVMPYESKLNGIHTCFMRFPIDVYFLDSNLDLVDKRRGISPWNLGVYPKKPARYIVEVRAGNVIDIEKVKEFLRKDLNPRTKKK